MCVCDGADTKSSIVGRRVHIPGQKRHKFGQSNSSTEGSASDNLIAETRCFVFEWRVSATVQWRVSATV